MKKKKNAKLDKIMLYSQIILFVILAILLIVAIFVDIMPIVQIVTAILLFVIAYNNFYNFRKNKLFFIIYILMGILSLVLGIMELI